MLFFLNDTPSSVIYTLSLHDALPICVSVLGFSLAAGLSNSGISTGYFSKPSKVRRVRSMPWVRSEEHTSELQSRPHLVCRLLLEKKKNTLLTVLYIYPSTRCFRY